VTGGNVSFYNENPDGAVFPTPTIGMLGVVENVERFATTCEFKEAGDVILLLFPGDEVRDKDIGGSEYLSEIHGLCVGDAPHLDLEAERSIHEAFLELVHAGLVRSAHDISDGGLAVCLAESVIHSLGLGADVRLNPGSSRLDALLFAESQSRIVLTVEPGGVGAAGEIIQAHGLAHTSLGVVTDTDFCITVDGEVVFNASHAELRHGYDNAIPSLMQSGR
jgi:phosphoribosylformylglycinamidine synthase